MGRESKKQKKAAARKARQLELLKLPVEKQNFDTLNKKIADTKGNTTNDYNRYMSGTTGSYAYTYKSCNHAPVLVCEVGGINLYAATKSSITRENAKNIQLIVNCSGISVSLGGKNDVEKLIIGSDKFDTLKGYILSLPVAEELRLDWTDGGIWPSGIAFWRELFDICKANNFTNIVFTCVGGHGRTGTALISFAIANSAYHVGMSVMYTKELNKRYCSQAVETMMQDEYLDVLEKEVRESSVDSLEVVNWIAPVSSNSAATGTAKIELTKDDSNDGPAISLDTSGKYCCINCGHLEEFCSCGQCPSCNHFSDLCDCTLSEKYQARKLLKEVKEFEDRKVIAEVKDMTDGEAQELANKALVQEMTKQAVKDYQWK